MREDDQEDPQAKMRGRIEKLRDQSAEERWQKDYKQGVNQSNPQNVKVVGLDIPFRDLVWLTVYNGFAVLIGIIIIFIITTVGLGIIIGTIILIGFLFELSVTEASLSLILLISIIIATMWSISRYQ
jgi:hypothetical protein